MWISVLCSVMQVMCTNTKILRLSMWGSSKFQPKRVIIALMIERNPLYSCTRLYETVRIHPVVKLHIPCFSFSTHESAWCKYNCFLIDIHNKFSTHHTSLQTSQLLHICFTQSCLLQINILFYGSKSKYFSFCSEIIKESAHNKILFLF